MLRKNLTDWKAHLTQVWPWTVSGGYAQLQTLPLDVVFAVKVKLTIETHFISNDIGESPVGVFPRGFIRRRDNL